MAIEVPDTRAFADPPPRRRRAAAPPVPVEPAELEPAELVPAEPVPAEPVAAELVVAPVTASAFSRPVRRRPKAEPAPVPEPVVAAEPAVVKPAVVEPAVVEVPVAVEAPVVEERRGVEGVAEEVAELTDTVVVRLAGTRYSVAMEAVAEVGRPPHVTRVPGVPAWIAGVANWRGRVLPVIDLRVLLGAPSLELGVSGRILVLARDGVTLAFLAERVEGVVSLEMDALEPVLATLSRTTASIFAGQLTHPDGPIAVLDLDTIFGLRSQLPRVRRAG